MVAAVAAAAALNSKNVGASGVGERVRVCYGAHLTTLSLRDEDNSWTLLEGTVLTTLHGHVL